MIKVRVLPDAFGPLSAIVPSSAIKAANKEVTEILNCKSKGESSRSCHRGQYETFTPVEKATIAKYALEVGVTKAIRKLELQFPERKLKEPTVRSWSVEYGGT